MVGYDKEDNMTTNQKLFAGCLSGVVTRFITQPMDVIKVRTQLVKHKPNPRRKWFRITRKIMKHEGLLAFWHGHNLGQAHSILSVGSQFFAYEMATKWVAGSNVDSAYKPFLNVMSGIFAGCASAALVIPLEVIRVRQIMISNQYKGLFKGAREVYLSGGPRAFYEGLSAGLIQMGPQVGISFYVFGFVQPFILKYFETRPPEAIELSPGNPHKPENLLLASSIAGAAAGFCSKTVTYPFDLAKRRMQIASHKDAAVDAHQPTSKNLIKCKKLMQCLYKTYQRDGIIGLFVGWKVTIYKAQLTSVVAFTSYELMCYTIREMSLGI